ncbi:MAG: DUF4236 domain-containing protein [Spirochaetaceae bacterium]|nr:DUF4236 domain-containing protein [Spirochaetaceae bacterium]
MSLSYRKSLKIGGVRINLSKSGIGFSTGIKGFRVGVNSRGKTYISGGRNGFYFRENLHSNKNVNTTKNEQTSILSADDMLLSICLITIALSCLIIGILSLKSFLIGISLFLFLIGIILPIRKMIIYKHFTKKIKKITTEVKTLVDNSDYNKIVDVINFMESEHIPSEIIVEVLDGVYRKFIEQVLKDKRITTDENNIINVLSRYMPEDEIFRLNNIAIYDVVCDILNDNVVTEDEEKALTEILSILKITDEKRDAVNKTIAEYRKIREMQNSKLQPISVSNGIPCYYKSNIDVLSRKKGKYSYYEYDTIGRGVIEIYSDFLELIVEGDKKIKMNDILDLSISDGILHLIVRNRKTPIYLKSQEPAYIIAIISKIKV